MQLLSQSLWIDANDQALASLESNKEAVFREPLEAGKLAVALVELNELVLLALWVEVEDLGVGDDTTHELICVCLFWAPPHIRRFTLDNERVKWSVSLVIGHCEHLVRGA